MSDRTQVLRAAARLLTHRPQASMADVAEAAGISRATLHRLVQDRQSLITAVAELSRERALAVLEAADLERGTATEALERLVHAVADVADLFGFLVNEPRAWQEDDDLDEELDRRVTALFLRGQESGEFRVDHQARWMTDAFASLLGGAAWSVSAGRLAASDLGHVVLETLLSGCRRPDAPPGGPR